MARADQRPAGVDLTHAGAGTALAIVQLSALIPGLLPGIILIAALGTLLVVPLLAVGLVTAVLLVPPAGVWLAVRRHRFRRRRENPDRTSAHSTVSHATVSSTHHLSH